MSVLMAIDPGNCSGIAVFDKGILYDVYLHDWSKSQFVNTSKYLDPDELVIEIPKIYPRENWKGDPNDEIKVAVIAGKFIGCFNNLPYSRIQEVRPHQWKGSRPKKVHCLYILGLLLPKEIVVLERDLKKSYMVIKDEISQDKKTKTHNAIDAIGVGLWKLRRVQK